MSHTEVSPWADMTATTEDHPSNLLQRESKGHSKAYHLMQKYNHHSERVLKTVTQTSLSDKMRAEKVKMQDEDVIKMPDLEPLAEAAKVPLEIPDEQAYMGTWIASAQVSSADRVHLTQKAPVGGWLSFKESLKAWQGIQSGKMSAPLVMTDETFHAFRNSFGDDDRQCSVDMDVFRELCESNPAILALYTTINEILKHFWSSYPPKSLEAKAKNKRMTMILEDLQAKYQQWESSAKPDERFPNINPIQVLNSVKGPLRTAIEKGNTRVQQPSGQPPLPMSAPSEMEDTSQSNMKRARTSRQD